MNTQQQLDDFAKRLAQIETSTLPALDKQVAVLTTAKPEELRVELQAVKAATIPVLEQRIAKLEAARLIVIVVCSFLGIGGGGLALWLLKSFNTITSASAVAKAQIDLEARDASEKLKVQAGEEAKRLQASGSLPPIGSILAYAGPTITATGSPAIPPGWLLCDGAEEQINAFSELFAVIEHRYGIPSASGVFRLPDLQGQFLRGVAPDVAYDPGLLSRTYRGSWAQQPPSVGSYQKEGVIAHSHGANVGELQLSASGNHVNHGGYLQAFGDAPEYLKMKVNVSFGGEETRPRNVAVYWLIRAK